MKKKAKEKLRLDQEKEKLPNLVVENLKHWTAGVFNTIVFARRDS